VDSSSRCNDDVAPGSVVDVDGGSVEVVASRAVVVVTGATVDGEEDVPEHAERINTHALRSGALILTPRRRSSRKQSST
jgi:hypothetical protein